MAQASDTLADPDLVGQAVAGDRAVLERLLLRCHRPLRARIEKKLPSALAASVSAEDILQDAFAEAFRKIGTFEPRGGNAFYGWLCLIADHRLADMVKSRRTAKRGGDRVAIQPPLNAEVSTVADVLALLAVHESTPSRSVARHEAVVAVRSALLGLTGDYRQALELRYIQGLPVADIATRMNRTERAVHMLCNRGLKALHVSLGNSSQFFSRPG